MSDEKVETAALQKKVEVAELDTADFEKRFLALIYQSNVQITASNVAYHLDLPIEDVQEELLSLELNGVIQQQMDDEGNTHYVMPNRPAAGTQRLGAATADRVNINTSNNPADLPTAANYSNPGVPAKNMYGMVLNFVVPGLGSLIAGKKLGLAMMGLVLLGLLTFLLPLGWARLAGMVPIAAGVLWSWIAGVMLMFGHKGR